VLLRKLRMTGAEIALCLAMARSTVSAILQRVGLGKLSRVQRPNRRRPQPQAARSSPRRAEQPSWVLH